MQFSAQYHENEANADEAECNSEPRSISLHQVSVGAFLNLTLSFAPPFEPICHTGYWSTRTMVKQELCSIRPSLTK